MARKLSLLEWLIERKANCLRIVATKDDYAERCGWYEDAEYFEDAITFINANSGSTTLRAQLRSSAEEIGRLTKALRRLAEFPADDAGLSEGALSKYWKQRMDTARDIARTALTTPATEGST